MYMEPNEMIKMASFLLSSRLRRGSETEKLSKKSTNKDSLFSRKEQFLLLTEVEKGCGHRSVVSPQWTLLHFPSVKFYSPLFSSPAFTILRFLFSFTGPRVVSSHKKEQQPSLLSPVLRVTQQHDFSSVFLHNKSHNLRHDQNKRL